MLTEPSTTGRGNPGETPPLRERGVSQMEMFQDGIEKRHCPVLEFRIHRLS